MSRGGTRGFGRACLFGTCLILTACSGSSKQKETDNLSEGLILTGSVGDGPVVGADIRVLDARGSIVAGAVSDAGARYHLLVPDGTPLPVTVIASGGTDLVTGRALDFELSAKALESGSRLLNLSPYTTLASEAADCRLAGTGESFSTALPESLNDIHTTLNFGWDRTQQSDPFADEITADNVAMVLLSNEALGELIRRTTSALSSSSSVSSADAVVRTLACDLADGRLDGAGPGVDTRVAMTAMGAAIGVQLEVLAGELYVDGQNSIPLLDDALRTVQPDSVLSVQDAPAVDAQLRSLRSGIAVMEGVFEGGEFRQLQRELNGLTRGNARATTRAALTTRTRNSLTQFPEQIALASEQDIEALVERQSVVDQAPTPVLSFSADALQLTSGQTTRLSWASSGTDYCLASEGWSGERAADGVFQTGPLTSGATYRLDCFGPGGSVSETVVVNVAGSTPIPVPDPTPVPPVPVPPPPVPPAPPAQPSLALQAVVQSLVSGSSTTLSWVSTNTTSCSASGAWSGNRNRNGTSSVGPLTATSTFALSCTGAGGSVSDAVTIVVTPAPPPPPTPVPVVSIGASNGSITAGQSTTLNWTSTNASSCTASGGWSGGRAISGSVGMTPGGTTTYTLTCTGAGGSRSASTTVSVTAAPPPPPPAPLPTVTIGVSNSTIAAGNSTTLSWSSTNASSCSASGGWSGARSTSGTSSVSPTSSTSYTLTCTGTGGSRSGTVAVNVTPAPAPQLTFTSADSTVASGGTTQLSWSSTNATSCSASGGWSGARGLSGNQMVGPLGSTTTFTLTCSGPGGNLVRMLTVSMMGQVSLNWVAPAQNVDGSPLNDLAGFRIYFGMSSRAYTDVVDIGSPNTTSFVLQQVQGDYYFAMTALDGDGNESAYSNEVRRTAQ